MKGGTVDLPDETEDEFLVSVRDVLSSNVRHVEPELLAHLRNDTE